MELSSLQAGLFIAEEKQTQRQFLVCLEGETPMLSVKNILDLSNFINCTNIVQTISLQEYRNKIQKHPSEFIFNKFEAKIIIDKPNVEKKTASMLLDLPIKSRNTFKKLIKNNNNEDYDQAIMLLCSELGISYDEASDFCKLYRNSLKLI